MKTKPMQNKHLEHPEDCILTGDLSVLDWFSEVESTISVKMDGAPAVCWGTNPANGKWFVGTKSVFNKVKIKIAHSHEDIDTFYTGKVAEILHLCFDYLPRTQKIIQGDWIGVGGSQEYKPNTITYRFPEVIKEEIIVCPHTIYSGGNDLREVSAAPLSSKLKSTKKCLFVQPEVELNPFREDLEDVCKFAKQMSTLCEFVSERKALQIKKEINTCIREQRVVDENEIAEKCDCDKNLIRLHKLVKSIKDDMFLFIHELDEIECFINGEASFHEGYVINNKFGTYKVVDREVFSAANFTTAKNWG
jgi:ribosomal protein S18